MEVVIDSAIFDKFRRWSGWVPAGYFASWLGVLTPISYLTIRKFPDVVHERRFEEPAYPECGSEILDHVVLLESILDSGETFVMVDLGAGWGRWMSYAASAARLQGRRYYLVGVEAEPQHFQWMEEHLDAAGIEHRERRLLQAAVGAKKGDCWFYVGRPGGWYGQSAVPDTDVVYEGPQPIPPGTELKHNQEIIRRLPTIDLPEILDGVPPVDMLCLDIQGAELEALAAHAELLDSRVKQANIATHSPQVEQGLRELFHSLGWKPRYDVALRATGSVRLAANDVREVQFKDGVQIWLNPRF